MSNDLTFFTNEPSATLLDRFKATLRGVQYFDILVGYFRTSGFHMLHESFDSIEKIRILVGLNVDRQAFEVLEASRQQLELPFHSSKQVKEEFTNSVALEMAHSEDSYATELGVRKFIEFLCAGKLELKAHPSQRVHDPLLQGSPSALAVGGIEAKPTGLGH